MVTLEQFRYIPTHAMRPSACYDFHYARPGMVAIFGENGSGKSTLAQLMAGWYPDFLPGEIEGAGTLLGNRATIAGRAVEYHPACAAVTLPAAFRLYFQRGGRSGVWPGKSLPYRD